MPKIANREYRSMILEALREEEQTEEKKQVVNGYATTFNEEYVLYEDDDLVYKEKVARTAFDNTDMSDVIMQYDHEGRVYARTSNNTLKVEPDERGLFIEADLGGTDIGKELYTEIAGGYTDKMSFGFTVGADQEEKTLAEDGRTVITRTITGISKLYDVSAVSLPANNGTSIGVATRKRIDGEIEEIRTERSEAARVALERRRAEVRARALGKDIEK